MKFVYDYEKNGELEKIHSVVLMSKSPRRRELLSFLNLKLASIEIDERDIENRYMDIYKDDEFLVRAGKTCCEIAKEKSNITNLEANTLYISSDTMVILDDKIYGKPKDLDQAKAMFMSYFSKSHHVITSVCLRSTSYIDVFFTVAEVRFTDYYNSLDEVIDNYINENNVMDKAGAYGIQDLDPRLISYICGDINTIIGLPVTELSKRIGDKIWLNIFCGI